MAIITLMPGEKVVIQFHESDGEFEIHFDTAGHPDAIVVKETGGFEGSVKGAALEIMHHEQFDTGDPEDVAAPACNCDDGTCTGL